MRDGGWAAALAHELAALPESGATTTASEHYDARRTLAGCDGPFVRDHLPSAPAMVVEIGCGSLGGFVPALWREGYDAVGVDPQAPEGLGYHRVTFEHHELPRSVDAMVACTSLHHVADLDQVADRVRAALAPGGMLVMVEWAWERFDEPSALWCFARLAPTAVAADPGWLHRRRDEWGATDQPWEEYWRDWANGAPPPSRDILDTLEVVRPCGAGGRTVLFHRA